MIGNSVPPLMSYNFALSILKQTDIGGDTIDENEDLNFHSRRRTSSEEYKDKARKRIDEIY
jgi:hypothetical protein